MAPTSPAGLGVHGYHCQKQAAKMTTLTSPELKLLSSCVFILNHEAASQEVSISPLLAEGPGALWQLCPSSISPGQKVSLCLLTFTPIKGSGLQPPPPISSVLCSTSLHPFPLIQSLWRTTGTFCYKIQVRVDHPSSVRS